MMTFALAIKENFTIKSQNRVAMVQISWEITRWCYGCTFRLDLVLLNPWVFWVITGLDAPILKTMSAEASNCNLTFCKTRQLAAWLQISPKWQVQTGFQAYSSKKKWDLILLWPMSESQSGKREGFQDNATRKKREVYCWLESGLLPQSMQWCRVREPWAHAVIQIYRVCISSW